MRLRFVRPVRGGAGGECRRLSAQYPGAEPLVTGAMRAAAPRLSIFVYARARCRAGTLPQWPSWLSQDGAKETIMIRIIAAGTLLAALAGSNALAQGSYMHHDFCLQKGAGKICAYDTIDQCQSAKTDNTQTCMPNSAPQNH